MYSKGDAGSVLDMSKKRKNYENTYKLTPDEKPKMVKIRATMADIVRGTCEEQDYQRASNSNVIVALNTELQRRVKTLCPDRHRCCVQTFFVENKDQGKSITARLSTESTEYWVLSTTDCNT